MPTKSAISRDYVTAVNKGVSVGGDVYGLPLAFDTMALYYNVTLLDKAGVAQPPKTWEEFQDAVKKATKFDSSGKIIQSGVSMGTGNNIDNAGDIFALLLMQSGIKVSEGGRVSFAADRNVPAESNPVLQVLRFYTDFARIDKEVYSWNVEMENAFNAFISGRSAFYFGYAFDASRIHARAPQLNIDVVAIPQMNPESPVNVASYWLESVVKKSTHQNEAWDFVRFMTSAANVKIYVEATGQPSPLRAQLAEQKDLPELAPFASSALVAIDWYEGRNYDVAKVAIGDLMRDYLLPYGEKEDPQKRDTELITKAALVIQQTY